MFQIQIKSNIQYDSDKRGNRGSETDHGQAGIWLDTHYVCKRQADQKRLDESLHHNPESLVVAVEVADHAEKDGGHDCLRREAL